MTKNSLYQKQWREKKWQLEPWQKHLARVRSRCHNKTSRYFKRGIKNYLTITDIKELWNRDKAYLLKEPSLDRKDGLGNYTKENCRFIELFDNRKQKSHYPKGVIRPKRRKAIIQCDLNGKEIRIFDCRTEAGKITGIPYKNISNCLVGRNKTSGGFKWKFLK